MTSPRPSAVPGPPPAPGPLLRDGAQATPVGVGPGGRPDLTAGSPPDLHPGVAAALGRLAELDDVPVSDHVDVLDAVHRLLQDALATLDEV